MSYKIKTSTVVSDAYCDNCKSNLHFVYPDNNLPQFEGVLHITFEGGYGEYADTAACIGSKPINIQLCITCADQLLNKNEWLVPIFNSSGSIFKVKINVRK